MVDNSSQPGTSAGSANVINNMYGVPIETFQQYNHFTSTSSAKIVIDYCPAPDFTFLGRYEELWTLKTLLTQHQMVVLVGMEGMGKTQLSRKYVQVYKANYQYRFWLESETPEKLANSFKKFAKRLHIESDNVDNEVVNDVYRKIDTVRTILIFDNVENPKEIYHYLPTKFDLPPEVTIHVLITSRSTDWTDDEKIKCYKLQPLDVSESLQILKRKFDENDRKEIQDKWEELAEMLGYRPLALQEAASNIYKKYKQNSDLGIVLADYIKQQQSKLIDTEEIIPKNPREPAQQESNQNAEVAEACGSNIDNFYQHTPSTHAPKHNPINNIELAVDTFIGRKTELSDIMQLFHEYPVVVIAAMGGMGKTQLARKFASVNADVYRDRYWINAETEAQLLKSFNRLAKKVKVDANTDIDTVRAVYRSFTEGAALLIFDNVENVNYVYEYLPTRIQLEDITLHVLITSRWTQWACDEQIQCYKLQSFDISTSLQIFQRKFDEICIKTMQEQWEKLAEKLGYLPLALQVATSYIYKRYEHNSDLGTVLADYMKLEEGANGLKQLENETISATFHQSTPSTRAPRRNPINNVELPVNTFIGRETELSDIKQFFNHNSVVVIAAMGGMGKTQLARKFACVNAKEYRDRYWINAETEKQLLRSFDRLADKVNVKANTDIETVRDTYRSFTEGAALLIFDNVEHVKNVYDYLPTRIPLKDITLHVLITSRWTEWTCDEQIKCYKLEPFDISTSLQIFQRKFDETCIKTMQDEWEELARMLGYLPLALQVAASYIYKQSKHNSDLRTVLAEYMKQLKEGAAGLLNDPLTEYGNRSVYASMMLTLKQLENKANSVSNVQHDVQWKFAVTIINTVAYMNPDGIYKEDLLKLVDIPENIYKFDEALAILTEYLLLNQKYSLLNQGVNWVGATIYSVHRIIQTSIRHNQTLMGTADKYYIRALKYALAEGYIPWDVLQYANERASAVADYYKDNPSPRILEYLVKNKAIRAMEAVLKLISKNQSQIAIKEHDLLHHAVDSGYLSMTQLLCKYGADINQLCRKGAGEPPLHRAVKKGYMDIATWLLKNGAAPTVRDREFC